MGYLDNSTTNIILDAVLTDQGRRFLSKNDGSFNITKFALGDDDIDYGIIKSFGRIIGKEKVEKNTPVLEALTNENVSQKYKLIYLTNQNLFKLPTLTLALGASTSGRVELITTNSTQNSKRVTIDQNLSGQTFEIELVDQNYVIFLNNRFLQIEEDDPVSIDNYQIARYFLPRDDGQVTQGSQITFRIRLKTITNTLFETFGKTQDKNVIITHVRVQGVNTGITKEFEVQITK
jgi:hypothetical protein|tara:strand:+ start:8772 stop:9473 length:702 start_codon:yes stop_codon:yes gene_type:complete